MSTQDLTFEEAKAFYKKGKRIARRAWRQPRYLFSAGGVCHLFGANGKSKVWDINQEDNSKDWFVLED